VKTTRRFIQFAFLALVLAAVFVWRANAELWCPFGGVEAIFNYFTEGSMLCSLGVTNFYVLGGVIVMTLVVRRVFCGYLCPIGALSEWLHTLSTRLGVKTVHVPPNVDRLLSLLKYVVLAIVLWLTWQAGELIFRGFCPCYALISRHGTDITYWAYVAAAVTVFFSLIFTVPFCRWFCPLAAVLNPFSRFGFARLRRSSSACVSCGKCATVCPMSIPVDQLKEVTVARCTACMNCVESCPKPGALSWKLKGIAAPGRHSPQLQQAMLITVLLLCVTGMVAATYLFPMPSFVKTSRATPPATTAQVTLQITDLTCRGRANLLVWFLQRDDLSAIPGSAPGEPGYFKLEAWPGPNSAEARISYDPTCCDDLTIKQAITEPCFDINANQWRASPFTIEGYDILAP